MQFVAWLASRHSARISSGRLDRRLEHELDREVAFGVQALDDELGVFGNLLQDLVAIQMLAADDEPDFELLEEVVPLRMSSQGRAVVCRRRVGNRVGRYFCP
jgi:hypothetical protein